MMSHKRSAIIRYSFFVLILISIVSSVFLQRLFQRSCVIYIIHCPYGKPIILNVYIYSILFFKSPMFQCSNSEKESNTLTLQFIISMLDTIPMIQSTLKLILQLLFLLFNYAQQSITSPIEENSRKRFKNDMLYTLSNAMIR